jgi:hypothetical protein
MSAMSPVCAQKRTSANTFGFTCFNISVRRRRGLAPTSKLVIISYLRSRNAAQIDLGGVDSRRLVRLLTWPHNAAMVYYGAGIVAVGAGLVWFAWR